ncbi:uncharacterized protein LOC128953972 isoform X2 [Oppia nitens]|uniref:uncharacterized protein LOC128953972 isoform X2 n=1 Tax=Oppia nitens TaxID=1686743 RepID=UPI0023DBA2F9|nr:uncharacterized protein LOC128953972 isoform X2 [Oppia nitens]
MDNISLEPSKHSSKDLDTLLAKLENDNKLLAELDCKLKTKTTTAANNTYSAGSIIELPDSGVESLDNTTSINVGAISGGHSISTSMPSLTSAYLYQTPSLTDSGIGTGSQGSKSSTQTVKSGLSGSALLAQNGNKSLSTSQHMVNHLLDDDLDMMDMELMHDTDYLDSLVRDSSSNSRLKLMSSADRLLDDNDLLLLSSTAGRHSSSHLRHRLTKMHSKTTDAITPYHLHTSSYEPLIKHTGALIDNKTPSLSTRHDLDKLMAKLDQDNKILAELDRKLRNVTSSGLIDSAMAAHYYPMSSSLPSLNTASSAALFRSSMQPMDRPAIGGPIMGTSALLAGLQAKSLASVPQSATVPTIAAGAAAHNGHQFLHTSHTPFHQPVDELKLAEDIVDSIEIPNRGRCKVYIARYSYDPYKQSPNDNPEQELQLLAGDFVLIFGNVDEDGFYFGECLDGRRGLIPSNFVEKLTGEDLFEFQASVLYGRDSESDTASYPPEFYDAILNDQMCHSNFQHLLAPDDFHRINDYIDLEDITEIDEDVSDLERAEDLTAKSTVAPPQRLLLERQLHKSVLIGWLHPECPKSFIESFQIYVDGVLKATIPSGDRTKALVEGVDSSMPHRISVRAMDRGGRQSKDPACTVVIGKSIPFAPCCVKASNITSDTAIISWLPCNSNFYHVVAVNSVEVRTVRPSVYKHLITGLAANTMYRVSVRAKPGKLLCSDEKNPKKLEMLTTFVDFRTLPKSLPDPPVDVQIESGPQEGTLLVTWLPVTLNQFGTSNNCPVTGYAVFAGHKKLSEIDSPTGDHALLEIALLEHLHKKAVTVRTKSGENLSQDSMPCQIPDELLKCPPMQLHSNRKMAYDAHRTNKLMAGTGRPLQRTSATNRALQQQQRHHHLQQQQQQLLQQQSHHHMSSHPQTHHITGQAIGGGSHHPHHTHHGMSDGLGGDGRMTIPAIEITKDTPSESINPIESYSEEEFDASMRRTAGGRIVGGGPYGASPVPPQRTRAISDYERSHFGPSDHPNRRLVSSAQMQRDRERGIRWFVALFDYDPLTMSPNPDAAEEELPFQEGQLIKIFGDKDADGFYRGEANGRIGFVPCNMVSEAQYDNETDMRLRQHQQMAGPGGSAGPAGDPWSHLNVRKMVALYDYDPQELSPNVDAEMELAFNTGDIVYVYGDMDEDGFYMGDVNGVRGLVPSNFLSEVPSGGGGGPTGGTGPSQMGPVGMQGAPGLVGPSGTVGNIGAPAPIGTSTAVTAASAATAPGDPNARHGRHPSQLVGGQSMLGQRGDLHMMVGQQPVHPMSGPHMPGQQQPGVGYPGDTRRTAGAMGQPYMGPQGQLIYPSGQQQGSGQYPYTQQSGHPMSGQQQGYNQQQHYQQQQQQAGQQMLGRGMRQQVPPQGPMGAMGPMGPHGMQSAGSHHQQGYNAMFPTGGVTMPGNKQRPTSLDLHSATNNPRLNQPNLQNQSQQQQQQTGSGMLGSLFASGKKILEEATTPLGARGPLAHPNQSHAPMGHHPLTGQAGYDQYGPNAGPLHHQQQQQQQLHQQQQHMYGQTGGQPMMATGQGMPGQGMPGQGMPGQQGGTILNTMKNIFKL